MFGSLLRHIPPILATLALLSGEVALAQRVVVLEFTGDRQGRLRAQVEQELAKLLRAEKVKVKVISLREYKSAAAKKRLKGPRAMTSAAVAKVGKLLKLDAAVGGAVGGTFHVRIVDGKGARVSAKDIPLKRGRLSPSHAERLACAIATAVRPSAEQLSCVGARKSAEAPKPAGPPIEQARAPEKEPVDPADSQTPKANATETVPTPPIAQTTQRAETDHSQTSRTAETTPTQPSRTAEATVAEVSSGPQASRVEKTARRVVVPLDLEKEIDPEAEEEPRKPQSGPKLFSLQLGGSTTWRAYCSRPGVQSCSEYDALRQSKPKGETVDFTPQVPYLGFSGEVQAFPLARAGNLAKGFGVIGNYSLGYSRTSVGETTDPSGSGEKLAISKDEGFMGQATFRHFFPFGGGAVPLAGFVGLRAGLAGRTFEVDPSALESFPGANRGYPVAGLDVALPLARLMRFEGGFTYFFNPRAGPEEIRGYGDPADPTGGAVGRGFAVHAGLTGDLWGPLGYALRFDLSSYSDLFFGMGQKWQWCDSAQCGGAAQESYAGLNWALTASY